MGANLRTFEKMNEEVCGMDPRRLARHDDLWDQLERSYDMWTSAIALREEMTRDMYHARRYERMLEWKERPLSLGRSRLQHEPCGAPEAWTDRCNSDPWVDQLLLSRTVRSLSFKVALSATLREALQLLPGGGRPL